MKRNSVFIGIKKYIAITLILSLAFYSVLGFVNLGEGEIQANTTPRFSYDVAGINDATHPGYRQRIQDLQRQFPNWTFRLFYTGLTWDEAIVGQLQGHGSTPTSLFEFAAGNRDRRLALSYLWDSWF